MTRLGNTQTMADAVGLGWQATTQTENCWKPTSREMQSWLRMWRGVASLTHLDQASWVGQRTVAGSPTTGSSRVVAIVASLTYLVRWAAYSSFCSSRTGKRPLKHVDQAGRGSFATGLRDQRLARVATSAFNCPSKTSGSKSSPSRSRISVWRSSSESARASSTLAWPHWPPTSSGGQRPEASVERG
jgi:hypothetical protein